MLQVKSVTVKRAAENMIHIPAFAAALYHSAGQLGCLPGGGVAVKQTLVCGSERACLSATCVKHRSFPKTAKSLFLFSF